MGQCQRAEAHNVNSMSLVLHLANREVEITGNVANERREEGSHDNIVGTLHGAPGGVVLREGDGYVAPHGQGHREPDGDGVKNLSEVCMEEDEDSPRPRVLRGQWSALPNILVHSIGDVLHHDQQVGGSKPCEDGISWGKHSAPGQHHHVDDVGH